MKRWGPIGGLLFALGLFLTLPLPALAGHSPQTAAKRLILPYVSASPTTETLIAVNAFFAGGYPQAIDLRFHNPDCSVNVNRSESLGVASSDRGLAVYTMGAFGTGISEGWVDIQQSNDAVPNRLTAAVTIIDFANDVFLTYNAVPLTDGNQALLNDVGAGLTFNPALAVFPPILTGKIVLVSVGAFAANGGGPRTLNVQIHDANGDLSQTTVGPFSCQFKSDIDALLPGTHRNLLPGAPSTDHELFWPYFRPQAIGAGGAPTAALYIEIYNDGTFHWGHVLEPW